MDGHDQDQRRECADDTRNDDDDTHRISRTQERGKPAQPRRGRPSKSLAMSLQPRPLAPKPTTDVMQQEPMMMIPSSEKQKPVPIKPLRESKSTAPFSYMEMISKPDTGAANSTDRFRSSAAKLNTRTSAGPCVAGPSALGMLTPTTPNSRKAGHGAENGALAKAHEASDHTESDHETDIGSETANEEEVDGSRSGSRPQSIVVEPPTPRSKSPTTTMDIDDEPALLSAWTRNRHDDLSNHLAPSILAARGAVTSPTTYQNQDGSSYRTSIMERNRVPVDVARHEMPQRGQEQYSGQRRFPPK